MDHGRVTIQLANWSNTTGHLNNNFGAKLLCNVMIKSAHMAYHIIFIPVAKVSQLSGRIVDIHQHYTSISIYTFNELLTLEALQIIFLQIKVYSRGSPLGNENVKIKHHDIDIDIDVIIKLMGLTSIHLDDY